MHDQVEDVKTDTRQAQLQPEEQPESQPHPQQQHLLQAHGPPENDDDGELPAFSDDSSDSDNSFQQSPVEECAKGTCDNRRECDIGITIVTVIIHNYIGVNCGVSLK